MSARDRFLKAVEEQLGKPVVWAATAPDAFDCSELVAWGLLQAGGPDQRGTHTAQRYHDETRPLKDGEPRLPGDLCFYGAPVYEKNEDGNFIRDSKGNRIVKVPAEQNVSHVTVFDEYGGCISADGATKSITSLKVAMANPANRVKRHATVEYRKDTTYIVVHRNTLVDDLDKVSR